jgi:MFS family permease
LQRTFDAHVELLTWTVTAYGAGLAATLIPGGRLADAAGRRRVLIAGSVVFALAATASCLAVSAGQLIAARAVQGLAAGILTPASFSLLLGESQVSLRPRAVGVWSAAAATSAFLGPPLGGLLVELSDWRVPMALSAVMSLGLAAAVSRLPERRNADEPPPGIAGTALVGAGVVALVLTASQADGWGSTDPRMFAGICAGAIMLGIGAFGVGKLRKGIVDSALLRRPAFAIANLLSAVFGFAAFAWLLAAPLFAAIVWKWNPLLASLSVAPGAVAAAVAAWGAGRLAARARPWVIAVGGALFACTAAALYAVLDRSPDPFVVWLPAGIVAGMSIGAVLASLSAIVAASVPDRQLAQGGGINMTVRQLGGALGLAVVGASVGGAGAVADVAAFRAVWLVAGTASLLTASGSLVLMRRGRFRCRVGGDLGRAWAAGRSYVRLGR